MTAFFRNQYLTVKEAAELLGIHEMTVRKWIWSKKLPAFQLGSGKGSIRISRVDLELLIETAKELFAKKLDEKASNKEATSDANQQSPQLSHATKAPR